MVKEDNLEEIRAINSMLIYAVPIEPGSFVCNHPFANSSFTVVSVNGKSEMVDIGEPEHFYKWAESMKQKFEAANLAALFSMVQSAYKLTWLKLCKPYMTKDTFSEYLESCWTEEENPNMDVNVKIPTLIRWFKAANKEKLMNAEDYEYFCNLPDMITVYRGVSPGRKEMGLSWTDSQDKAEWFQHRFDNLGRGKKGYLLKATVPKEYALAYFNTRDEQEIVLDVKAAKDLIERV